MKIKAAFLIAVLIILSGCATSRGVIDVEEEALINPDNGFAFKFVRVTDKRDFQVSPRQADIPSLKNNEIDDDSITSRAIARKRNTYGKALGDILLPEGKTVMSIVENRLANGLLENGYRILYPEDAGYDSATPVEVDIKKFWGWFSPGFWSIGINFQTSILVIAPVNGLESGVVFESEVQERFQVASGSNWEKVINSSLRELSKEIQRALSTSNFGSN